MNDRRSIPRFVLGFILGFCCAVVMFHPGSPCSVVSEAD
jgi:hypothetical protein